MIESAFDNKEELEKAIKKLLDDKLVAGCQVVESNSTWNWKSTRENSKEYLLLMKTRKSLAPKIYDIIRDIHSYDCFELATFYLTSCNKEYLDWINKETNND